MLKCMEGETEASIASQLKLFHERILPTLDDNIKCGNSLIDVDFYNTELDFGEEKKIKPFSWKKAFSDVFKHGGFDCVIGNPPYVSIKEIDGNLKKYFIATFKVATGQFDLYTLFIEKSFFLLKKSGLLGMITSNTYINNKDSKTLRNLILSQSIILEISNLGETVFKDANLDVSILIISMNKEAKSKVRVIKNSEDFKIQNYHYTIQDVWHKNEDHVFNINMNNSDIELIEKIFDCNQHLSDFLFLPRGIEIGSNSPLIIQTGSNKTEPVLFGKNIKRYQTVFAKNYITFDVKNKAIFKDINIYKQPKILIQRIRNLSLKQRIVATYDKDGFICTNTLRIGIPKNETLPLKFILGILNSKLINWIFLKKFLNKDIYAYQLEQIPMLIPKRNQESEVIKLVDTILKLNEEIREQKLQTKINQLQSRIDFCEQRINEIVYELYELTKEEIELIEKGS